MNLMPHNYLQPYHHHHDQDHHHLFALFSYLQAFTLFVWRGDLKKPYGLRATSNVVNHMFTGAFAKLLNTTRPLLKA